LIHGDHEKIVYDLHLYSMKVKTNVTDPKPGAVRTGSKSVIVRNKKGETEAVRKKGDAYINEETLEEDRKIAKGTGSGQYAGSASAPRTGGKASATQGAAPMGGTKKQVKASKMRVRTNNASPQAKRAARKLY
jgi:hypothetical protein